jgi:hypothetical protein
MRLIGEIKLLLNDEDSLYSPKIREGVFSETQRSKGHEKSQGSWSLALKAQTL